MKWENLIKLKIGDEVEYKKDVCDKKTYTDIITHIDEDCHLLCGTLCVSTTRGYRNRMCIGTIRFNNLRSRCGVEDGWSLIDPKIEFEDFISIEEMKVE